MMAAAADTKDLKITRDKRIVDGRFKNNNAKD